MIRLFGYLIATCTSISFGEDHRLNSVEVRILTELSGLRTIDVVSNKAKAENMEEAARVTRRVAEEIMKVKRVHELKKNTIVPLAKEQDHMLQEKGCSCCKCRPDFEPHSCADAHVPVRLSFTNVDG